MRPLRFSINVTLDGCCDHAVFEPDQMQHDHAAEGIRQSDALLFGRKTYQMMEEAWRFAPDGAPPNWIDDALMPFARQIDAARKYVVSDTLTEVDWNAEIIRGSELEAAVRALKQQPGKGLLTGGVTLPRALADLGLVDEFEFLVHPKLAGHGPAPFQGMANPLDLQLMERRNISAGVVSMQYALAR